MKRSSVQNSYSDSQARSASYAKRMAQKKEREDRIKAFKLSQKKTKAPSEGLSEISMTPSIDTRSEYSTFAQKKTSILEAELGELKTRLYQKRLAEEILKLKLLLGDTTEVETNSAEEVETELETWLYFTATSSKSAKLNHFRSEKEAAASLRKDLALGMRCSNIVNAEARIKW